MYRPTNAHMGVPNVPPVFPLGDIATQLTKIRTKHQRSCRKSFRVSLESLRGGSLSRPTLSKAHLKTERISPSLDLLPRIGEEKGRDGEGGTLGTTAMGAAVTVNPRNKKKIQ
uniref:Uncharacterized protein n=1 Tax=Knipowitschia caucasica TaxID=637954 RepID=A0AAV2LEA7_KNICA